MVRQGYDGVRISVTSKGAHNTETVRSEEPEVLSISYDNNYNDLSSNSFMYPTELFTRRNNMNRIDT